MDFIGPELPEEVERYLQQYDDLLTRREQREHFRYYIAGLISETHRKNVGQMMAKVVEGDYQSGHHFLAEAPWSADALNERRVGLWQQGLQTRMRREGWFLQDDTGQERRKRGKSTPESETRLSGGTDGVAHQYIGNVGKTSEGLVFVSTHYADTTKRLALKADLFWPEKAQARLPEKEQTSARQRDKIDIALDQLHWVADEKKVPGAKPQGVVADAWYGSSPRYVNAVNDTLKWRYVVGIRRNRTLFIRLPGERGQPEHHAEEVIPFLKADAFTAVSVRRSNGQEDTRWVAKLQAQHRVKVKGLTHRTQVFLCVDDPSRIDPEEAQFLLTNDEQMSEAEVVQVYGLRNWEEVFYRQGKDELGLDQCEVRHEERLLRHWVLVMVTWTMLETFRVRGDLAQRSHTTLDTLESIVRLLRDLCRWEFWFVWMRTPEHVKRFVTWFCQTRGLRVAFDDG